MGGINIPAGLAIPPGPPSSPSLPPSSPGSPSLPPSSPGSPSLTNVTPLSLPGSPSLPPSSPGSPSLTNVTLLSPPGLTPGPSKKTRIVRPRPKLSLSHGQKFLDQLKLEASQRPKRPTVIPIMSKIPISKRSQSHETDLDDAMKKLNEPNKLLKKQEQDKQNKLLEKQKINKKKIYIGMK